MNARNKIEAIDHDRRRVMGMAAMGITVAGAASLLPSRLAAALAGDVIRQRPRHSDSAGRRRIDRDSTAKHSGRH